MARRFMFISSFLNEFAEFVSTSMVMFRSLVLPMARRIGYRLYRKAVYSFSSFTRTFFHSTVPRAPL